MLYLNICLGRDGSQGPKGDQGDQGFKGLNNLVYTHIYEYRLNIIRIHLTYIIRGVLTLNSLVQPIIILIKRHIRLIKIN